MRATAPQGRAAFQGVPGWTPSAGVGLRPPEAGQGNAVSPDPEDQEGDE
jgi:hypothetical protein